MTSKVHYQTTKKNQTRELVSIVSISYNQEKFIKECLESFIIQKHDDFDIEIIIADDASSDSTQDIIREYAKKYPIIKPVLRTKNIGIKDNLLDALSRAGGKYIALCEGDDYWTSDIKLSKQYTYMQANKNVSLCFHPVEIVYANDNHSNEIFPDESAWSDLSINNLLDHNFIQTNSVMYRNTFNYKNILSGEPLPLDWFLHIYHAKEGSIGFIPEVMSVYRRHEESVWWRTEQTNTAFWRKNALKLMATFDNISKLFPKDPLKQKIIETSRINSIYFIGGDDISYDNESIIELVAKKYPNIILTYAEQLQVNILKTEVRANSLKSQLEVLQKEHETLQSNLIGKEADVERLLYTLEEIHSSKAYKLANKARRLKQIVKAKL